MLPFLVAFELTQNYANICFELPLNVLPPLPRAQYDDLLVETWIAYKCHSHVQDITTGSREGIDVH